MQTFVGAFDQETYVLPWEHRLAVPDYKEFKRGQWELTHNRMPPMLRGYYTDIHTPDHPTNPVLKKGDNVWMSVTPMELESQAPHAHFATGHTVIAGLGMGVVLYNILRKPEVTKVTVLEKDKHVIAMFGKIADACNWEGYDKLIIVNCDAYEWKTDEHVDFLCVDTFQKMMSSENVEKLQLMNSNIVPDLIAGWTTELEFVDWCSSNARPAVEVDDEDYDVFMMDTGLPLIKWDGIAQYCLTVGYHTAMY